MENTKKVPVLRFPEFKGETSKSFTIIDIAKIQVGKDLKEDSFSEIKTEKYCYPVYSNTIANRGLYGFYDFEEYDGNSLTVVGRGAGLGTAFARKSGFGAIGRLLVISPKSNNFNVYYFAEYVNFKLKIHNESGGIPQLPMATFGSYEVVLPPILEQTKIANFISQIDNRIEKLTKKKQLLESYKKGVMQKIFNQEIRFKDDNGQSFSEWKEKKFGDVGVIITGKTPSTTDESLWNGNIQFVTPTDITKEKYQFKTQRTVKNTNLKILPKNSIMFTCIASIGKMSLSVNPCITNQQINSLIPNDSYNKEYVYYAILSITDYIKSTQANTTLPIINKTEFSKFKIPIPSIKEQTKIADFLTEIDCKINIVSKQLEGTKKYKNGLLKKMFV